MTDHLEPGMRSALMARIRGRHTQPELTVRRIAHRMGLRFRLHRRDLPGTPDLVFPARKSVVFVHGCWWHRHPNCAKASGAKTRPEYWRAKFDRNVERDRGVKQQLEESGWRVITIWECETKSEAVIESLLREIIDLKS
jgi:DNA mismatch endonuclease (patch repair protein)